MTWEIKRKLSGSTRLQQYSAKWWSIKTTITMVSPMWSSMLHQPSWKKKLVWRMKWISISVVTTVSLDLYWLDFGLAWFISLHDLNSLESPLECHEFSNRYNSLVPNSRIPGIPCQLTSYWIYVTTVTQGFVVHMFPRIPILRTIFEK